jgi:hypothetical protein
VNESSQYRSYANLVDSSLTSNAGTRQVKFNVLQDTFILSEEDLLGLEENHLFPHVFIEMMIRDFAHDSMYILPVESSERMFEAQEHGSSATFSLFMESVTGDQQQQTRAVQSKYFVMVVRSTNNHY